MNTQTLWRLWEKKGIASQNLELQPEGEKEKNCCRNIHIQKPTANHWHHRETVLSCRIHTLSNIGAVPNGFCQTSFSSQQILESSCQGVVHIWNASNHQHRSTVLISVYKLFKMIPSWLVLIFGQCFGTLVCSCAILVTSPFLTHQSEQYVDPFSTRHTLCSSPISKGSSTTLNHFQELTQFKKILYKLQALSIFGTKHCFRQHPLPILLYLLISPNVRSCRGRRHQRGSVTVFVDSKQNVLEILNRSRTQQGTTVVHNFLHTREHLLRWSHQACGQVSEVLFTTSGKKKLWPCILQTWHGVVTGPVDLLILPLTVFRLFRVCVTIHICVLIAKQLTQTPPLPLLAC